MLRTRAASDLSGATRKRPSICTAISMLRGKLEGISADGRNDSNACGRVETGWCARCHCSNLIG